MTTLLIAAASFVVLTAVMSREGYARRFVGLATPRPLACIRILTSLLLIYYLVVEDMPRIAGIPDALARWNQTVWFLDGTVPSLFERLQQSPTSLRVLQLTSIGTAVLALLGWRVRVTVPLAAVLATTCGAIFRQYLGWAHLGAAAIYVMILLSFLPCGDAWSLDRRRRLKKGLPVQDMETPTERQGWALYAFWATLALIYLCAGLSKLRERGFEWSNATNMKLSIFKPINVYPSDWQSDSLQALAVLPDIAFAAMGIAGLLCELLFPLVLWFRWARLFFPAAMIGLHLLMLVTKNFVFLDCTVLLAAAMVIAARCQTTKKADDVSPGCRRLAWSALVAAVLVGQLVIWAVKCESYPATGFQMYAAPPLNGEITSQKVIIHEASGRKFHGCLAGEDRSYFDNRLLNKALMAVVDRAPKHQKAGLQYLDMLVRSWNDEAQPGERIVRFDTFKSVLDAKQRPGSTDWVTDRHEATFVVGADGSVRRKW